jgi:glutathione peroxidase-family protein
MCGFTAGNYPQLQELHRKYSEQGLSVLGSIIMLYLFQKFFYLFIYF